MAECRTLPVDWRVGLRWRASMVRASCWQASEGEAQHRSLRPLRSSTSGWSAELDKRLREDYADMPEVETSTSSMFLVRRST
jgi:hypothetical protein